MSVHRINGTPAPAAADAAQGKQTIDKAAVARLASEFESLLLSNILRDMRSAGRWSEEDSSDMLGAGAFEQTFDAELARALSQAGGFGLSGFLEKALDRYAPGGGTATTSAAITTGMTAAPAAMTAATPVTPRQTAVSTPSRTHASDAETERQGPAIDGLPRPAAALTSAFGWRKDPITGAAKFHSGVDFKAPEGQQVGATAAGRVVFSGWNGGYGNNVVVEHANGVRTRYAHLSATLVAVGDQVDTGQAIGRVGHTGRATGPHLHYEVIAQGRAIDPLR